MTLNMNSTPISNRICISIFGKRNAGKSSLINAITGQNSSLVSDIPGTTTDPVYKTMELLPLGPVVFVDTPGLDDDGQLGNLRVEKTYEVLRKTNMAIIVVSAQQGITQFEQDFIDELKLKKIPCICVINKADLNDFGDIELLDLQKKFKIPMQKASALTGMGIDKVKKLIVENCKSDKDDKGLIRDLIKPGDIVVLVTPIDDAAPKGRLILPQQQTIRDILDCNATAIVTKETELAATLQSLNRNPAIVITDSQVFAQVSAITPENIPLTSFSILFARQKSDLAVMVSGLKKLSQLKDGDRVLIMEGCTHHRQTDDIGTVKIPRWIREITGSEVQFEWASGAYYPKEIDSFDLIVHCGACMLNQKEMQYRVDFASQYGVSITNYGMLIAYVQGILSRALKPFPSIYSILQEINF